MTTATSVPHGSGEAARAIPAAPVAVSEGHCINVRGRQEACDLCRRACPANAITLSLDTVSIDPALCTGCGACVPACPGGALVHDMFDPETFIRQADGASSIRIGCVQGAGAALAVPCHKMLDARLLAALHAEGTSLIELTGAESCGDCPSGDARPDLKAAVRTLRKWFGDNGPVIVAPHTHDPAGGKAGGASRGSERRRLLRGAFASLSPDDAARAEPPGRARPSFDALLDPEGGDDEAPARPVPYQQALASRRASLPFREDGPVGATGRVISEACSGCLVCAELCPTGALGAEADAHSRLVSFDPARCTNCTLCLKVCPMRAIAAHELRGVAAAEAGREVLFLRRESTCSQCGNGFDPDEGTEAGLCPQCLNECDMDADWQEMLSGG